MTEFPRSRLGKVREAIAHDSWRHELLDAGITLPLLIAGVSALLRSEVNYLSVLLGVGIGATMAGAIFHPSIASRKLEILTLVFVAGGVEGLVHLEFSNSLLSFLIGVPPAVAITMFRSSPTYRRYLSYCYGAFLGPLICYNFIVVADMDFDNLGLTGYLLAVFIGVVLAIEMPIIYRRHGVRHLQKFSNEAHSLQTLDVASMIPLTFSVGLITGIGVTLTLFALRLMLLWTAGYVVAPFVVLIILYALRPR